MGRLYCPYSSEFSESSNFVLLRCSIHQDKTAGTDTASSIVHNLNVHYINALILCPRLQLCLIHSSLSDRKEIYFFQLQL